MNKINQYLDNLGYTTATKEAKNTLIGVILVKFGVGAIGIWGVTNTYFFSYFLKYNPQLKLSEFNFLVTVAAIPMILITLASLQICEKLGFERVIRVTMVINPICVLIGAFQKNFYTFAAFNTLVSSFSFGITAMPMLYCLWGHFPSKTGNTTGIVLASFGLATFFYSLIATFIVNPSNLLASIEYKEGTQVILLFNDGIVKNVPTMIFILGLLQCVFCIPGAFLITRVNNQQNTTIQKEDSQNEIQMKLLGKVTEDRLNYKNEEELKIEIQKENNQLIKEKKKNLLKQQVDNILQKPVQNIQKINKIIQQQMQKSKSDSQLMLPLNQLKIQQEHEIPLERLNLKEAAKTQPFIIIYISTFLLSCFSLFISLNYKTYGLTKINDDHFLTYLISLTTIFSSLSNIFWGYLVDKYQFRTVYIFLISIILVSGFLFPFLSSNIFGFSIIFQILGSTERGLYTIIGPGLVQIYGIKLGSELFPIKSTSFFLALVLVPVLQVFLLKIYTYDQIIHIFDIGIVISLFLSFQLKNKYDYYK